jgi:hypothetical protein
VSSAFDIFASLPSSARQLLPFFRQQAATEKTASEILRELKAEGVGIRRQTALDIIGALRGQISNARGARLQGPGFIPNPEQFGVAPNRLQRDFSHLVLVRSHDSQTGETINKYITVSTNELLSVQQIIDTAASYSESGGSGTADIVDSITLQESWRSPALGR